VALNISEVQWKPDSPGCEERPDCGMLYNTIIVRGARILSIIYFNISIAIKISKYYFSKIESMGGFCHEKSCVLNVMELRTRM
jgi:hypothetical protein